MKQDLPAEIMMTVRNYQSDDAFLDEFLQETSRTFALAIPLLSEVRRRQIGLSYLMFRVADSIEDAPDADAAVRKGLLTGFRRCVEQQSNVDSSDFAMELHRLPDLSALWPSQSPTGRLLSEFPRLMSIFGTMPESVSKAITQALTSTAAGMIEFLNSAGDSPNQIQIRTLTDLRLYCYAVAGIVGELLTDIFVIHHPAGLVSHRELRRLSVGFGEFLQLINILKDTRVDVAGGRLFIPKEATRESVHELALSGRKDAQMYISLLKQNEFPEDITRFCQFIFLLADGSLRRLQTGGVGSKLTRAEVMQILSDVRSESAVLPS